MKMTAVFPFCFQILPLLFGYSLGSSKPVFLYSEYDRSGEDPLVEVNTTNMKNFVYSGQNFLLRKGKVYPDTLKVRDGNDLKDLLVFTSANPHLNIHMVIHIIFKADDRKEKVTQEQLDDMFKILTQIRSKFRLEGIFIRLSIPSKSARIALMDSVRVLFPSVWYDVRELSHMDPKESYPTEIRSLTDGVIFSLMDYDKRRDTFAWNFHSICTGHYSKAKMSSLDTWRKENIPDGRLLPEFSLRSQVFHTKSKLYHNLEEPFEELRNVRRASLCASVKFFSAIHQTEYFSYLVKEGVTITHYSIEGLTRMIQQFFRANKRIAGIVYDVSEDAPRTTAKINRYYCQAESGSVLDNLVGGKKFPAFIECELFSTH